MRTLEREGRHSRRDAEAGDLRQRADQLFGDPVADVLGVGIRAEAHERQHGDGGDGEAGAARRRCGGAPQLGGEGGHGSIGRRFELGPDGALVLSRVLQRRGAVSRRHERAHQSDRHPRAQRIEPREPPPPRGSTRMIAPAGRVVGERLERRGDALRELCPLHLHEPLELERTAEMEPVEQGAAVRGHGALELMPRQCRLDVVQIDRDHVTIEAQLARAHGRVRLAQVSPQRIQQLGERMVGALRVALGPEIRHDLVAAHPFVASQGQEREEGEAAPLGRARWQRPVLAAERQ